MKQKIVALMLGLGLTLGLTGCGSPKLTTFDAKTYVQGLMDETYLGTASGDFMQMVEATEADIKEAYESGIQVESGYFATYFDIDQLDEDQEERVQEMYRQVYQHAKYEVVSAAEQEDGSWSVKVTIEPIDFIQLVNADFEEAMTPFWEKYPADVLNAMSDEEYAAVDAEWADMVLDLCEGKVAETGNLAQRSVTVQLEQDDDGYYTITDEDFGRLDEAILDYAGQVPGETGDEAEV